MTALKRDGISLGVKQQCYLAENTVGTKFLLRLLWKCVFLIHRVDNKLPRDNLLLNIVDLQIRERR